MIDKRANPLRLEPPELRSDEALGERLAQLAKASTPSPVRRRVAWRAPLAGLAIVVGTGGLAFGAESVVHHIDSPAVVVPTDGASVGDDASSGSASPRSSDPTGRASDPASGASERSHDGQGRHVGRGHAKGPQNAPGRSGTAPGQQRTKTRGKSSSAPGKGLVNQGGTHAHRGSGGTSHPATKSSGKASGKATVHPSKGSKARGHGG